MVTLLARLDAKTVHWFGTSMGGLIGMAVAGLPDTPVSRLVLNDVGPTIDPAGLARIGEYIGKPLTWTSEDDAADYLLTISQGFGPHTRAQWMALTRPMLRREGDRWRLHYDPAIGASLRAVTPEMAAAGQAALWAAYDRDLLSDAPSSWRELRRPRAGDGRGDGGARPEGAPARVPRRRPCADDRQRRSGGGGAGVPASGSVGGLT